MKLGKVLTYKDVAEAEKLEGKNVVASENLYLIEDEGFCLAYAKQYKITLVGARKGLYPFAISEGDKVQFIREVIDDETDKPLYEPYDLSDPKVRDSLRGRWYEDKRTGNEYQVFCFYKPQTEGDCWEIAPYYSAEDFLENCEWLDGTPCGRRVDKEMSSPVPTRDGKENEKRPNKR